MSNTIFMKLTGAIVVGGELVKPPAIVEVSPAEAADLARRGKAEPATADDQPSARSPSAENITSEAPEVVALPDDVADGEALVVAESESEAPAAGRRRRS